ncbi:MAG: hypothetical protein V3W41_22510 [Planctomycetota bacterium]
MARLHLKTELELQVVKVLGDPSPVHLTSLETVLRRPACRRLSYPWSSLAKAAAAFIAEVNPAVRIGHKKVLSTELGTCLEIRDQAPRRLARRVPARVQTAFSFSQICHQAEQRMLAGRETPPAPRLRDGGPA